MVVKQLTARIAKIRAVFVYAWLGIGTPQQDNHGQMSNLVPLWILLSDNRLWYGAKLHDTHYAERCIEVRPYLLN